MPKGRQREMAAKVGLLMGRQGQTRTKNLLPTRRHGKTDAPRRLPTGRHEGNGSWIRLPTGRQANFQGKILSFQHGFPSKIKGKIAKTEIKMPCGSPHSRFQIEKHPVLSQRMAFKAFLSKCQP